jgi:hypothetical protein
MVISSQSMHPFITVETPLAQIMDMVDMVSFTKKRRGERRREDMKAEPFEDLACSVG